MVDNKQEYFLDIRDISPKDALNKDWVDTYKKEHEAIWWEIVRYNTNLFILNKISKFPFKTFLISFNDSNFWRNTTRALFDSNILIIWRIVVDKGQDVLTIKRLKNSIRKNIIDNKIRSIFDKQLTEINFDEEVEQLEVKIKKIRTNYLAHFIRDSNVEQEDSSNDGIQIMYSDLNKFSDDIEKLFSIISFSDAHSTQTIGYLDSLINGEETDIDDVFNGLVRISSVLNMKEQQPDYFKQWIKDISLEDYKIINDYRKKFNMSQI